MTIPLDIRRRLGIDAGTDVDFHVGPDGAVRLVRRRTDSSAALVGGMPGRRLAMSTDEIMAFTRGA